MLDAASQRSRALFRIEDRLVAECADTSLWLTGMSDSAITNPVIRRSHRARTVVAISIGNALEWFEIAIYGFLAVTMAKLFFPTTDETISLLLTFGTFGVTFVARPLGAFALGRYADRQGRKKGLTLSLALMLVGTSAIACAPTYAQVGMAAPVVIILARLTQGFAAGGEFGSATALLAEQDPVRRGFYASWQHASQGLMSVMAGGCGYALYTVLTPAQVLGWGWRLPFFLGLLIGPVGLYVRRYLDESDELRSAVFVGPSTDTEIEGKAGRMVTSLGLYVLGTILSYTTIFMPTFAVKQLGLPASAAFIGTLVMGALKVVLCPCFGMLSDRIGRLKLMSVAATLLLLSIVPGFAGLVAWPTITTLIIVQGLIGAIASAYWGPVSAAMSELFPTKVRATGLSISYSVAVAIFGGGAPFISAWLILQTGTRIAPGFYVIFGTIVTLIAIRFARRYGVR
jgi:MFS transporter, MHS family, proline/betaine transporter